MHRTNIGDVFGRLTITKLNDNHNVIALCVCGTTKEYYEYSLIKGATQSCGCLRYEVSYDKATSHGQSNTSTYKTWCRMKSRCLDPNHDKYKYYGGRGIKVCAAWICSFESFLLDMGERPDGMSIERCDVNGNYEPSNCRWATRQEQENNKRPIKVITLTLGNETKTLKEWSQLLSIKEKTIRRRIEYHWPVEKILTRAVGHFR